jgi:hypothetical protein
VLIVAAGHNNTVYPVAIIVLALVTYLLWRNYRRRGEVVRGAGIAAAVDAVLQLLLAGEIGFVVLSVSPTVYVQFKTESNGAVLAEANCPAGNQAAETVLSTAGLTATKGPPNYRATFASADAGRLAGLVRSYLGALGAGSLTIETGR